MDICHDAQDMYLKCYIFISMKKVTDDEIITACNEEITMAKAAFKLGIHWNTLKRRAILLGVYHPNQGAKGSKKPLPQKRISLEEILKGMHPYYQTNKLRIRLINENVKENKCELCGIVDWLGKPVSFELDHINGIRSDHRLENLRIVCPNCHSQTETYRSKNIQKKCRD